MNIKLSSIRIDGGTQPRAQINESVVAEYGEALTAGAKLPPVTVFHDGADYWLADGFHRYHAHGKIGALDIDADIKTGTKRDAVLFSVGANHAHGLQRTREDKRNAVMTLLNDAEWATWSDNKIAKACSVSPTTVGDIRKALTIQMESEPASGVRKYTTKHGTTAVMNTANIGKLQPSKPAKEKRTLTAAQVAAPSADDELAEARHAITDLAAENEALRDRLAVEQMDADEEGKAEAASTIADLRERVRTLEAENDALKASRDTYMQKVSEMQKQITYWRKRAEKVAA